VEDKIRHNAELVVAQMRELCGFDFGYDARSVAWLDGYIERQRARPDITQETVGGLVSVLGSYLGECVIRCYGGRWEQEDGHWRVGFDAANAVYPFAKVQKQFLNGPGDSIRSFFETIPVVFALDGRRDDEAVDEGEAASKPWWKFW
jgi:hypothetical protein